MFVENEEDMLQPYNLVYKCGCVYFDKEKEKIVIPEKAMLYIDGTPIILKNCKKRIVTVEDAKKVRARYENNSERYDCIKHYIEAVRNLACDTKRSVSVDEFESIIGEIHGLRLGVIYKEVLGRVLGNKEPVIKLSKVDERLKYSTHIRKIGEKNRYLLAKVVDSKFELFTPEELLAIIKTFPYREKYEKYEVFKNIDAVVVTDDLIKSIDTKCDFKYLKLINSIKRLKKIEDKVWKTIDTCMLSDLDLEEMRKYEVKGKIINCSEDDSSEFIIQNSYHVTDLPEVSECEYGKQKSLKLN